MLDLFRHWMQKEGVQDIQLHQADALDLENQLPEGWKGYDLIVSSTMLEYISKEDLGQALGNLRKLLNREGRLLVFVTKRTWLTRWTAAKWWRTNLFDHEGLEGELRKAGFTTIQKKTLPGSWVTFIMVIEAGNSVYG
jgi:cyclopropane fatty-acyl-phospholipid synthase-like methyltransferase